MARFAEVLIDFLPTEKGGRRTAICLSTDAAAHYRPHFRLVDGDGEMLGVEFVDGPGDAMVPAMQCCRVQQPTRRFVLRTSPKSVTMHLWLAPSSRCWEVRESSVLGKSLGVSCSWTPRSTGGMVFVEEACFGHALVQRAKSEGENPVFYVLGQTGVGRYLFCVVIQFPDGKGYPITARAMTDKEKRRYRQWKNR